VSLPKNRFGVDRPILVAKLRGDAASCWLADEPVRSLTPAVHTEYSIRRKMSDQAVYTEKVIRFDSLKDSASVNGDDRVVSPASGCYGGAVDVEGAARGREHGTSAPVPTENSSAGVMRVETAGELSPPIVECNVDRTSFVGKLRVDAALRQPVLRIDHDAV